MTAGLTLRVYTGLNAGTESAHQSSISLTDIDALNGGAVMPGTYSFERWTRLRVDSPPALGVANFWFEALGDLPAGVEVRFGVTDTPATPVAAVSVVATHELQSGRRYIFDTATYAEAGEHTRYLVFQEHVDIGASPGAIDPLAYTFGWVEA